jgi:hypothetical protein
MTLQFDKTRIVVRERAYVDVLDLALRLIRVYAGPLLLAFAAGIVPVALFNWWLLADYAERNFELGFPLAYMFYMVLVVLFQAPLATAPATLYLGKAVFAERPDAREIAREFRQSLPQLLVCQVLLRPWYLRWCYLNEVILLERNRLRRKKGDGESTLERARILHLGEGGDLIARALAVMVVGGLLFASIWLSILALRGMLVQGWSFFDFRSMLWALLTGQLDWEFLRPMFRLYFPLTIWIVVAYFTVVRFLSYLDLRIRREGWEVELIMRAERARLTRNWP